jgi:hypothetical protein
MRLQGLGSAVMPQPRPRVRFRRSDRALAGAALPLAILVLVPVVLVAGLVAAVPSKGGSAPSSGGVSGTSVSISVRVVCVPTAGSVSILVPCPSGVGWHFSATTTGGIPPYVYLWSFGDGSAPAVGQSVDHIFPNHTVSGCQLYTVTVWVLDPAGAGSNTTALRGCTPV